MRKTVIGNYVAIVLTSPCLVLAVPVALFESALGTSGEFALRVAGPFLQAVERELRRTGR